MGLKWFRLVGEYTALDLSMSALKTASTAVRLRAGPLATAAARWLLSNPPASRALKDGFLDSDNARTTAISCSGERPGRAGFTKSDRVVT